MFLYRCFYEISWITCVLPVFGAILYGSEKVTLYANSIGLGRCTAEFILGQENKFNYFQILLKYDKKGFRNIEAIF